MIWENKASVYATVYDGRGLNSASGSIASGLRYSTDDGGLVYGYASYDVRYVGEALGGAAFGTYEPYYVQTTVGIEYHRQPDANSALKVYATYTDRDSAVSATQDAVIATFGGNFSVALGAAKLTLGGYVRDTTSDAATVAARTANASIGVAYPVNELLTIAGNLAYTRTEFGAVLYGYTQARQDDRVEVSITPKSVQFYGFNPTLGVNWTRNYSNLNRYDTEAVQAFTRLSAAF